MDWITAELFAPPVLPWRILLLRVMGAVILCGLIGIERETKNQPAGLRTQILVGLASCIYAIVTLTIVGQAQGDYVRVDPLRIVEAVTGGVAFLAAGMIVFHNGQVHGLTTGAAMWLSAAVGLCCGLGLWGLAVLGAILSLIVMIALRSVEDRLLHNTRKRGTDDSDTR